MKGISIARAMALGWGAKGRRTGNKYGARRTVGADGRTYDSAHEARTFDELDLEVRAKRWVSVIRQISFPVGIDGRGRSIRIRVDGLVIRRLFPGGWFIGRFVDPKGRDTESSRAKRGTARQFYGVDIRLY